MSESGPIASRAPRTALASWLGLAAFYTASFAALGVYMQFFPAWLHDVQGFGERDIAVVLSALTIARTFAGPLWAQRVDRTGDARAVLRLLAVGSTAAFVLFAWAPSTALAWAVAFLFGCVYPPMHPILDAAAVAVGARHGFAFGRLRMIGSLSFLVVIVAVGAVLERAGSGWVFPILLLALAATAGAAWLVPSADRAPPAAGLGAPALQLLRSRPFVALLVASALIQGSHATYYNLSTVHWNAHGIGKSLAALLWAEGVLAEIVLLFVAKHTVDRLRPTTLMAVGGAAAALRWTVVGATTSLPWLFAVNWLHGLSFAATYLGAIGAIQRRIAPHQRATAQGLLGAASSGVGMVGCGLLGGFAYERFAGGAFLSMAAVAALGVPLAVWLRATAPRALAAP